MRVLFVCTGNTCRSPMAASVFRRLCDEHGVVANIASAGLAASDGAPISRNARRTLDNAGIAVHCPTSSMLTTPLVENSDLIVTMTHGHSHAIHAQYPEATEKTAPLLTYAGMQNDVVDPFGGDLDEYQACLDSMALGLEALVEELKKTT